MTPIFAVGEKVRITDRVYDSYDYKYQYTDDMCDRFEGKIVTIKRVLPYNYQRECRVEDDCAAYFIEEDNGEFTWSSGMFDKIIPQPYSSERKMPNKNKEKARKALYASLEEQGINMY